MARKRTTIEGGVSVVRMTVSKREYLDNYEQMWRESLELGPGDNQVGDNCNNAVSVERTGDHLEVVTDILDDGVGRKLIVDFKEEIA
jgi:hypothetical protein